MTLIGNYHYKVMPCGLKNAGSTYQRMMTRMFEPQLGKSIEIYIDDIVVKSKVVSEHVGDLGVISTSWGNVNCVSTPLSAHLVSGQVNFWAIWWLTGELRWAQIRSKQFTICNLLETQKKSRDSLEWSWPWIGLFLDLRTDADPSTSWWINGKDLSGPRTVP